jgi:uncharacterized protein YqjF (DUF2071 family)
MRGTPPASRPLQRGLSAAVATAAGVRARDAAIGPIMPACDSDAPDDADVPMALLAQQPARMLEAALAALSPGSDAAAQVAALREVRHRPWPLPRRPWVQGQTWRDLLFAHWPVAPEALAALMPAKLPPDVFDGRAWISITPFAVRGVRLAGTPPVPFLSSFLETNVRTYTTVHGRPGIYFFSLDASSPLAVAGARRLYKLPYFHARMTALRSGADVVYETQRVGAAAALRLRYRPAGPRFRAVPGSLEHFLTERYRLYASDERRRIYRADIHHLPWPLQPAEAATEINTMTRPLGIELPPQPPLLHFAARQDVLVWPLRPA